MAEPNLSTEGIAVLENTLELNGGSIRTAGGGGDAALAHDGLAHDTEHKVDWQVASDTQGGVGSSGGPAATVTGVSVVSDPGADDTYGLDDTIRVRATFTEAVEVTGTPRLKIKMDPGYGEKWAAYADGGGTSSLAFTYKVVEPNLSTAGIAVLENTLELNGGRIRTAGGGADAALAHAGLAHDTDHQVDWRVASDTQGAGGTVGTPAPRVSGVTIASDPGADDTYRLGDTIQVRVAFNVAVNVTGSPRISIDLDPASWGTKHAAYASGGGTKALVFSYAVVEPNYSPQGIAVLADSLSANGGGIGSASSGTAAELAHTGLGHDAGHKVDWRPTISVADAKAKEGAGASAVFEVSLEPRLSRAATQAVTVDYATADGTAKAGEDYTAASGTLTFAPGESSKTVSVAVLDDAHDEGERDVHVLRLLNAVGARVWRTVEATGTIENNGPDAGGAAGALRPGDGGAGGGADRGAAGGGAAAGLHGAAGGPGATGRGARGTSRSASCRSSRRRARTRRARMHESGRRAGLVGRGRNGGGAPPRRRVRRGHERAGQPDGLGGHARRRGQAFAGGRRPRRRVVRRPGAERRPAVGFGVRAEPREPRRHAVGVEPQRAVVLHRHGGGAVPQRRRAYDDVRRRLGARAADARAVGGPHQGSGRLYRPERRGDDHVHDRVLPVGGLPGERPGLGVGGDGLRQGLAEPDAGGRRESWRRGCRWR